MNINLIYEGNKYEFDIPNQVNIKYIKELTSKIFHYEEKGLDLMFKDENLNDYNDKMLINELVSEYEKNITIHLVKSDLNAKTINLSSNESTNDTNCNDKYYKSLKKKFNKFYLIYSKKINDILKFEDNLYDVFEKLIQHIKIFKKDIFKINEILGNFYNNNNYNKLISIFDKNKTEQGFNEKDLKRINDDIDKLIFSFKYLITQKNFQINIIEFIENQIENMKNIKNEFTHFENEKNNYDKIVGLINNFFNNYKTNNKKHLNSNDVSFFNEHNFNSSNASFDFNKKKKQNILPKIENNSFRDKTLNNFKPNSDKHSKKIKLIKNNVLFFNQNDLSLSLNKSPKKNIKKQLIESSNSNKNNNILPGIDIKNIDTKTNNSTFNTTKSKLKNIIKKQISLSNDSKSSNSKKNIKNKSLDKEILINEVKPKIMDKIDNKKNISRNEKLNNSLNIKNQNLISNVFNSTIKENSGNKSLPKTERNKNNKKEENLLNNSFIKNSNINIKISNNNNNNIINNNTQKDFKKNNDKEKSIHFNIENEKEKEKERNKSKETTKSLFDINNYIKNKSRHNTNVTYDHYNEMNQTLKSNKTFRKSLIKNNKDDDNILKITSKDFNRNEKKRKNTIKSIVDSTILSPNKKEKDNELRYNKKRKTSKKQTDNNNNSDDENNNKLNNRNNKENSQEQIKQIAKDLLSSNNSNIKQITFYRNKNIKKSLNNEIKKENEMNVNNNSNDDSNNEKNNDEINNEKNEDDNNKKKKKRLQQINKYDFII